jgi:hypothetical protein
MMHLAAVHDQLIGSRWLQTHCVVAPAANAKFQAILPIHEDCMAVVLPFRQLYSKDGMDDLFNRCRTIHNRHCPKDHPTHAWVDNYRKQFNALLEKPVGFPLNGCALPARRYLDAFAYGARVVHVSSKKSSPAEDLKNLLASHPREMVVMGYHARSDFF